MQDKNDVAAELSGFEDLWDYYDPAASQQRFEQFLAGRSLSDAARGEVLTQIARARGLQNDFEGASERLAEADRLIDPANQRGQARIAIERGRVANSSGDPAGARPYFEKSWELAQAAGVDWLAVDAAHMLGIVEKGDVSRTWNERALELASSSADPRAQRWQASLLNNMAWSLHGNGKYTDALQRFDQALRFRIEQRHQADDVRVARWCVGRCLRSLKRYEQALALQRTNEYELRLCGGDPDGFIFEEIAECLTALGRGDEAKPYFLRAYKLLSEDEHLVASEPQRLERLKRLGGDRGGD